MTMQDHEIFHTSQVNKLRYKPGLVNLEGIALSTSESVLFNPSGIILREPDGLMFDPTTKTLYNIEYKTTDTKSAYNRAKFQLITSKRYLENVFKEWKVVNLYVSGNFDTKILKR